MASMKISLPPHLTANQSTPSHPGPSHPSPKNPLPHLLHTPSGLAILEIQGTINAPHPQNSPPPPPPPSSTSTQTQTHVGKLVFPGYFLTSAGYGGGNGGGEEWMKRVYLYVGKHQRMLGEVKRLEVPLGVLRRRSLAGGEGEGAGAGESEGGVRSDEGSGKGGGDGYQAGNGEGQGEGEGEGEGEELEIVEVVRYKILFSGRPEPVGEDEMEG
ncbi:hypothetical protein K402DRAFT_400158 [Aulographum hederae CBS 113979]|uniref:Sister chromatid cohesion protein Ctf8 n=1 Tax=Aulographum hederae CBS 113979 TaxID=1176131 RepID=A0A6G1HDV1_9PEZI|nr:hypothetical protein K402DRAFT_400158 [Aulographum hederae CBS 113979]